MKGLEFPTSSVLGYCWISYNPGLKTFTGKNDSRGVVALDSPEFRAAKWFRSTGRRLVEHWAYRANAFVPVSGRRQINWSVGVPGVKFGGRRRAKLMYLSQHHTQPGDLPQCGSITDHGRTLLAIGGLEARAG